jgi:Cu-Zn family superoxide dismutase
MPCLRTAVAFALLVAASLAGAQEAPDVPHADTAVVTAIDAGAKTITIGDAAAAVRYAIGEQTVIRVGAEEIPLSQLAVGDRVTVTATRAAAAAQGGAPVADTVQVVQRPGAVSAPPPATGALQASLADAQGKPVGSVTLRETPNGVLVEAELAGLPPGEHGFHVHEKGACTPPFESAGNHLAEPDSPHGFLVAAGPHAGDLPNLVVARDGRARAQLFAAGLRFEQIRDGDGAAIVVHAEPDDHQSQPAGASGDRIACGVIGPLDAASAAASP